MKNPILRRIIAYVSVSLLCAISMSMTTVLAGQEGNGLDYSEDMLMAVSELYGLSETQTVDRLAKEAEAAVTFQKIKELSIDSYAGSWFDASVGQLVVAVADVEDMESLKMLDVKPVVVSKSLKMLEKELSGALQELNTDQYLTSAIQHTYVDIKSNTPVIVVGSNRKFELEFELASAGLLNSIQVVQENTQPELSTGNVRGANGTRNLTWQQVYGGSWPCSIGVSVEDGFVTAGHCGEPGDDFGDANSNSLGEVQGSTWFSSNPGIDSAYVETFAGWTPTNQINGYSEGTFTVSKEWAGMREYPIGTTVCRYGQTSGGPHCGTVDQLNVSVTFGTQTVTGLTQLSGSCSDAGDSGGPHVAGTGQIQGTNTGTQKYNATDTCPTSAQYVWFQPIKDTLDTFGVTMLTTHGSSAPVLTSVECPDHINSGNGKFFCIVNDVDSQGEVQFLWTSIGVPSSTSSVFFRNCTPSQTVNVTLKATNPYGTETKYYSFTCEGGPPN